MAPLERRNRRFPRWEAAIFAGAILLRLFILSRFAELPYFAQQMGDMKFYHDWAVRILHGQFTDGHAFYGLPGYAYLLAGFYRVVGTDFPLTWLVLAGVQSAIEAVTAVLIFKFARRICCYESIEPSKPRPKIPALVGVIASATYVFFAPAQAFSIILMPTAWLVCAYWFCVWQAMTGGFTRSWIRSLGMGVLVGVVAMMIATILFAIPLLLLALFVPRKPEEDVTPPSRRYSALCAAVLIAGVFLGTSPAWIHNYYVAKDPVLLSAHGGLNFWMGNGPGATGYPKIPEGMRPSQEGLLKDSIKWAEEAAGHPLKRTEVSKYWSAKANAYIWSHPGEWIRLMGVKIRNFWNTFQYDDISVITLLRERGVLLSGLSFGTIAAFGLAGAAVAFWRRSQARWVAAAVLLHMAALLSVFITERYRLAAVPGLIILGAYLLWRLWLSLKSHQWAPAGAIALLLIATSLATSASSPDPSLWSLDPYNVGVKELAIAETLLAAGGSVEQKAANHTMATEELRHAERHLRRAYAWLQGNPGILFALGNLALDRGDQAQARQWYDRTIEISPTYAGALKNLGFLDVEAKQWAAADKHLTAALQIESDNATTCYLLAKAKIGLGDRASARAVLDEALRMKPAQPEFLELRKSLLSPGEAP